MCFFGISHAPNHTSEMQLAGWKQKPDQSYQTYNNSPTGQLHPVNINAFAAYLLGLGSDHAEDQKKLAQLLEDWKKISDRVMHGEKQMQQMALNELLPIIAEESEHKIEAAGGIVAWEAMSKDEKDSRDRGAYECLCA